MSDPTDRRGFFRDLVDPFRRARERATATPRRPIFRPPWALPEEEFLAACTKCDACVEACPRDTIRRGPDFMPGGEGYPVLFLNRTPCDHCGACAEACPTTAIRKGLSPREARMGRAKIETSHCVLGEGEACRACVDACPFPDEAISIREGYFPHVDPSVCTGCGLCVEPCPGKAVYVVPA
jgi:ferredoxin-type protein NapF